MSKSITRNTVSKFILSFFNIIIPVLVGPYINRLLDIQQYGIYNKAISILAFFMVFATFGIYNYGVREISKVRDDKKKLSSLFTNLFLFGIITNICVTLIYMFYVMFAVKSSEQVIFYILIIQILGNTFMVEWVNEAVENYGFITKKTVIIRIISTILLFLVVTKPEHVIIYAILISLTNAVNYLASFLYVKRYIKFDFSNIQLTKYIKPLSLLVIISNANILFTTLDRIMLGGYVDNVAVSNYTIPSNIINMVVLLMMSLIMVSIPRLNYYVSQGETNQYLDLLSKSSRSYLMLIFPSCVGLFCLSYEVMMIFGSAKYIGAYPVLQVFALRFITTSVFTIFSNQILYIYRKEKQLVYMMVFGGVLNVIFNYTLVYFGHFTPVSAIATTAIAEFIMLAIMYYYIRTKMQVDFHLFAFKNMKYLYFSIVFIPIVYAVRMLALGTIITCVISILICCFCYFGILFLTKDDMFMFFLNKATAKFLKK